jgi:hypothetical protein
LQWWGIFVIGEYMKRFKSKHRRNYTGLSWVGNDRENILIRMCELTDKEGKQDDPIPKLTKVETMENEN